MKWVHGKRLHRQEKLWGFTLVSELRAGVKTFGLILGYSVWGVQWLIRRS